MPHPAYRGGVQVPCGRHPFALLCATSTTTSTSRWDENAVGCLIWRRYRRLAGGHAVRMSAPGPADRPQARAGSRYFRPCLASAVRIAGPTQGIRSLETPLDYLFECSNTSRSCHRLGAKMGSHSAKSRQGSAGVWTVICRGRQHFANLLDSSRPAPGLLHTEEVTGSIPVSPTQLSGRFQFRESAVFVAVQHLSTATASCRATGRVYAARRG